MMLQFCAAVESVSRSDHAERLVGAISSMRYNATVDWVITRSDHAERLAGRIAAINFKAAVDRVTARSCRENSRHKLPCGRL